METSTRAGAIAESVIVNLCNGSGQRNTCQKGAAVKGALVNSRCSLRNGIAGSSLSPRIGNKRIVLFTEQNAVQCIKRRMLRGDGNGLQQRTAAEGVMVKIDNRIGKGYGVREREKEMVSMLVTR